MWPMSGWMMSAAWRLEELAELDAVVDALAGRDRQVDLAATLARALRFSGGQGSSSQAGLNGASSLGQPDGGGGEKRPCISSSSSASGPMASRTASTRETERSGLGVVELEVAGAERVELQGPVAALDDALGRLVVGLRGALGGVPAVGVRLDPVA